MADVGERLKFVMQRWFACEVCTYEATAICSFPNLSIRSGQRDLRVNGIILKGRVWQWQGLSKGDERSRDKADRAEQAKLCCSENDKGN